jgi:hypothetical protein
MENGFFVRGTLSQGDVEDEKDRASTATINYDRHYGTCPKFASPKLSQLRRIGEPGSTQFFYPYD